MRILLVGQTKGYFIDRLTETAEKHGHTVVGVTNTSLIVDFRNNKMTTTVAGRRLEEFDLVHLFVLGNHRWPWITAVGELEQQRKISVVDNVFMTASFQDFSVLHEYQGQQELGIPAPKSVYVQSLESAQTIASDMGYPLIIKTNRSRKGLGVGLAKDAQDIEIFIEKHRDVPGVNFILRELIPNDGDIRVIVVDGRAIGAVKRTPKSGEFRANLSQGGSGSIFDLKTRPDVQDIAERAAKMCRYDIAGVDVMLHKETGAPYVLEVNRAPQFDPFEEILGIDLFTPIIDMYGKRLR